MPEIIPIPGTTTEERLKENMVDIKLDDSDLVELDEAVKKCTVHGDRYYAAQQSLLYGDSPEL
jgi:pyridoxine 4-dehydrogenase